MKKVFCLVIFSVMISFSAIQNSFAQITYEASYYNAFSTYGPNIIYFNHRSPKWMMTYGSFIYLYNLNHSLYLLIPMYGSAGAISYISDDLFDTDSTNLEFINHWGYYLKVFRQDGTVLFSRDTASIGGMALIADYDFKQSIFPTDSGTKMKLYIQNPPNSRYEIYSLPGHLPCRMTCSEHVVSEGLPTPINETAQKNFNNPYPNPTSSQTHIPYTLPDGETTGEIIFYDMTGAEVKRYKVDSTFSDLILSTSDLSAGSYYYQLQTAHSKSEGRKLVVIK